MDGNSHPHASCAFSSYRPSKDCKTTSTIVAPDPPNQTVANRARTTSSERRSRLRRLFCLIPSGFIAVAPKCPPSSGVSSHRNGSEGVGPVFLPGGGTHRPVLRIRYPHGMAHSKE